MIISFLCGTNTSEDLLKLKEKINEFHPSIKVFFEFSKRCIFYILTVYKASADKLGTTLHKEKTWQTRILPSKSEHSESIKRSIPHTQVIKIKQQVRYFSNLHLISLSFSAFALRTVALGEDVATVDQRTDYSVCLLALCKIPLAYCVCVKRITLCNCLCSSSPSFPSRRSSGDFASVIRNIGKFGAKSYFTDQRAANTIQFRSLKYMTVIRIRKNWAIFSIQLIAARREQYWCKQPTSNYSYILIQIVR